MKTLSIVVPTYNERENIKNLVVRIFSVLEKNRLEGEVIVVDDNSPDGTGEMAEELEKNFNLRVIRRAKKSGLGSAILEGLDATEGEIIGVMDADFSHPPEIIPDLIKPIMENNADFVVGSRYIEGGYIKSWSIKRRLVSKTARVLAAGLTGIKDPLSGFFFARKGLLNNVSLESNSCKVCLEILVRLNPRTKEMPYVFENRKRGESKMGMLETLNYTSQLFRLYRKRI